MKRLMIFLTIWGLALNLTAFAQVGDAGEAGSFMKLGSGVRAISLGRAFVAIADDASASYWNPAGLAQIKGGKLSLMYAEPFGKVAGITHQNIGYALESKYFNYGLNFIYAGVTGLEGYDNQAQSTKKFGSSEWAALFSLAYPPSKNFFWGATVKMVSQQIEDYEGKGVGMDLGFLMKGERHLQIGVLWENFVPPKVVLRTVETYPRRVRYGLMLGPYHFYRRFAAALSFDQLSAPQKAPKQFYGLETAYNNRIFMRSGYNTASMEQSYGGGVTIRQLNLDYAYLIHPYLGDTHRAGITLNF